MKVKRVIEQIEHIFGRQSEGYMLQLINDALLDIGSTKQHLLEEKAIHLVEDKRWYDIDDDITISTATTVSPFPDEAEYLVPLRAAITAAEYQLAIEEDAELYLPIIATIKSQYQEAVMGLKTGNIMPTQQKAR